MEYPSCPPQPEGPTTLFRTKLEPPETCIGLRFRGLSFEVMNDQHGEYLRLLIPASEIPDALTKVLKDAGLRPSQRDEIVRQIEVMACFNHMQDRIDDE